MHFRDKLIAWADLPQWREALRQLRQTLVVTNGCFDLLHLGHVTYLESARNLGHALLVGVNGDASVRQLKGPSRPLHTEVDRALVLAALESVSAVCIFQEKEATRFLSAAQPDLYVKGGDYTLDTLNQEERRVVEAAGGRIQVLPVVAGKSTTALLEKIARL
ncbi:MAG TPA: adenylyltransferase/cytidyltransferase family protein [Verrucomicrobiota bacterium]|nr:adenylyltransferase/cytidyltransferase family protein [Verrucomicrobiota bacterium]HNT15951.1 adenylyltransferase/cytidyltransferase family protein [Verrucomicrobiota bacterium]